MLPTGEFLLKEKLMKTSLISLTLQKENFGASGDIYDAEFGVSREFFVRLSKPGNAILSNAR